MAAPIADVMGSYPAAMSVTGERDVLHKHAGVNGHVVDALLGLLFDHFEENLDVQVFHAAHAAQGFVDGHGANRHGRGVNDCLPDTRDVAAGGEVHHGVGP